MTAVDQRTERRPPRPRRPSAEARSWAFMRLSGLLLLFFALVHFAITHIVNDVVETDYDFVAERWANPAWRVFDWMLLVLALSHGLNGLRWIVDDYVRGPGRRKAVKGLLYGLTAVLVVVGTITIVVFPSRPR
ncbi:MAG: succinate dehydrogenase hydrophobic membrane anchor subunit [Actinomycetota bacterium]|nr:succinate dehydrogenase hydrophobic membrane anchor subunit [Actinomycetota bacterium]